MSRAPWAAWGFARASGWALAIAVAAALTATALAIYSAAANHPGEAMILFGYGVPLALIWGLAGFLLYLPRRLRETARLAQAHGRTDPRTTAFLDWAEQEQLIEQKRGPEA
jgi:hypothetical protein